uniref:Uncharacterized protein n=1 Tax=Nelumbo nucifera TaxID=4432 RepID=A0A822XE53_NELNU|nr:TPA_asm: hypothetical protein HUJ06_020073 [Nelumbo nucifera]
MSKMAFCMPATTQSFEWYSNEMPAKWLLACLQLLNYLSGTVMKCIQQLHHIKLSGSIFEYFVWYVHSKYHHRRIARSCPVFSPNVSPCS